MKVFYQPYTLTPTQKLNAVDEIKQKHGLYLKIEDDTTFLGDYFPHEGLGDLSVENILSDTDNAYLKNAIELAKLSDVKIQYKSFQNHLLNKFKSDHVTKYKIKSLNDFEEIAEGLKIAKKVRLDANGTFSIKELNKHLVKLDLSKIEYIEDPSHEKNWNDLVIPSAEDFIKNPHATFSIVKPNRCIQQNSNSIISSYMGSDWGRVLCTNFLHQFGNFELVHGIVTPNIYKEQVKLFDKNNKIIETEKLNLREKILDGQWHELKL